ncbi:MAG: hypothetical protein M1818_000791 [Claussenomyces sp. TS43310]|nr:MAG: hypothetical protein M1818_000791 [Claussenomyces sp. TS43310]
MASEDQNILAKISHLADGSTANTGWRPPRGRYPARGYSRGAKPPQVHRNRTLVLNGTTTTSSENTPPQATASSASAPAPAWVTKTDRHLQLINPAIFEKQSQERTKAIEETRRLKLKQRDEKERLKLEKHLQRLNARAPGDITTGHPSGSNSSSRIEHEISVQGMWFRVGRGGSKLMKIPGKIPHDERQSGGTAHKLDCDSHDSGDGNSANVTPKTAVVGGVRFHRSKNGNLYRSGVVRAQRYGPPHFILQRPEDVSELREH